MADGEKRALKLLPVLLAPLMRPFEGRSLCVEQRGKAPAHGIDELRKLCGRGHGEGADRRRRRDHDGPLYGCRNHPAPLLECGDLGAERGFGFKRISRRSIASMSDITVHLLAF